MKKSSETKKEPERPRVIMQGFGEVAQAVEISSLFASLPMMQIALEMKKP